MNKVKFDIYYDDDLRLDFNKESQKKGGSGMTIIVTPVDVHIPDAFRMFAYGLWLNEGGAPKPPDKQEEEDEYDSYYEVKDTDLDIALFGREPRKKSSRFNDSDL